MSRTYFFVVDDSCDLASRRFDWFFSWIFSLLKYVRELSEMILNQHLILRRMVYNSCPGHTSLSSMIRVIWGPVGLIGFFLGFFLFSSMPEESSKLILNQHLILRQMVYNACPGHTSLSSMIRVIWGPVGLIGFFLGFFLFSSMSEELREMILNQHLILR